MPGSARRLLALSGSLRGLPQRLDLWLVRAQVQSALQGLEAVPPQHRGHLPIFSGWRRHSAFTTSGTRTGC